MMLGFTKIQKKLLINDLKEKLKVQKFPNKLTNTAVLNFLKFRYIS